MAGHPSFGDFFGMNDERRWNPIDPGMTSRTKNQNVKTTEYGISACVTTFVGVFFFLVSMGLLVPVYSNVCRIENNTCIGCETCDSDNIRYGVEDGQYTEYSRLHTFILACAAGVLAFITSILMGQWSTSSLDWVSDFCLLIKNYLVGDRSVQWRVFFGNSVAYVTASLLAVLTLWLISEQSSNYLGLAGFTVQGSGSAGGFLRSTFVLIFACTFSTILFLWSRVTYVDGSVSDERLERTNTSDNLKDYYTVWPELGHHYARAFFNGTSWFVTVLISCYYVGPVPLQTWYLVWSSIFSLASGNSGGISVEYPEGIAYQGRHFLTFFLVAVVARLLATFILIGYVYLQGLSGIFKDSIEKTRATLGPKRG